MTPLEVAIERKKRKARQWLEDHLQKQTPDKTTEIIAKVFSMYKDAAAVLDEHGCLPMTTLLNDKRDDEVVLSVLTEQGSCRHR